MASSPSHAQLHSARGRCLPASPRKADILETGEIEIETGLVAEAGAGVLVLLG